MWLALRGRPACWERVVNLLEIWENALIYLTIILYGHGRHTGMIVWNDRTLFLSPHHGRLWGLSLCGFCGFPVEWSIIPGGHNGQPIPIYPYSFIYHSLPQFLSTFLIPTSYSSIHKFITQIPLILLNHILSHSLSYLSINIPFPQQLIHLP